MERQRSAAGGWVCRYINANIYNTPTDTGKGVGGGGKDGKGKKKRCGQKKRQSWMVCEASGKGHEVKQKTVRNRRPEIGLQRMCPLK